MFALFLYKLWVTYSVTRTFQFSNLGETMATQNRVLLCGRLHVIWASLYHLIGMCLSSKKRKETLIRPLGTCYLDRHVFESSKSPVLLSKGLTFLEITNNAASRVFSGPNQATTFPFNFIIPLIPWSHTRTFFKSLQMILWLKWNYL